MAAFHFRLAINIINRRGPSNEMHHQLQPNKTKGKAVLAIYIAEKTFYPSFITNKMERITFKNGCVVRVAKHLKEDWFIVLH